MGLVEKSRAIAGRVMNQTKVQSATEALTNIVVGWVINLCANFAIFPLFGWSITLEQNILLGVFYTGVSFVRSYALRRFYNWRQNGVGRT